VAAFDLPTPLVACFELDLALLLARLPERKYLYRPFSRFPRADRDLALVVDEPVTAERLQAIIEQHPLVRRVVLFDLFSGSTLPAGKKSLAYHLELQSDEGTLSTEAVNEVMATVVRRLEQEAGASLRA
jgi:phenylalanyl-tRNA synthetase beta chain